MSSLKFNEKGSQMWFIPYRECSVIVKAYTYFFPKIAELKPEKNTQYTKHKTLDKYL